MSDADLIPFRPSLSLSQARSLPAASLAYLGDAVFELFVRSQQLIPPRKIRDYHYGVVSQVRAETQAGIAQTVHPLLTEVEKDIFRRARNSAMGKPKRVPLAVYQQATGLEAVLGYLYLTDSLRLMEILQLCKTAPSLPPKRISPHGS